MFVANFNLVRKFRGKMRKFGFGFWFLWGLGNNLITLPLCFLEHGMFRYDNQEHKVCPKSYRDIVRVSFYSLYHWDVLLSSNWNLITRNGPLRIFNISIYILLLVYRKTPMELFFLQNPDSFIIITHMIQLICCLVSTNWFV